MKLARLDRIAALEWAANTTDPVMRAKILFLVSLSEGDMNFRWPRWDNPAADDPVVIPTQDPEPVPPSTKGADRTWRTWRDYHFQESPRWARYSSGGTCQFGNHTMEEGAELYVAQCIIRVTGEGRTLFGCASCADEIEIRWNREHGVAS